MIDILLATYNGAAYIREQIGSILQQTVADWHLLVHDDGSTDGTVDIVREYVQADKRIRLVEDGERHLGVAKNFLHLLKDVSQASIGIVYGYLPISSRGRRRGEGKSAWRIILVIYRYPLIVVDQPEFSSVPCYSCCFGYANRRRF